MANHHLRNRELSLKAKGLLSLMLSLPEDWDYTTKGLSCICKDGVGRYTVVELPTEDNYWLTELGFHDVTVKAGETTVDTWLNKEQGLVWFV